MSLRPLLCLTSALALAGCSMAPRYERPKAPVPEQFSQGEAYPEASDAALPSLDRAAIFTDPRLIKLMDQALANNRDLRVAAANVERARAQFRVQRASLFPEVDANFQASTSRIAPDVFSGTAAVPAWEIDLFGRIRSLSDAAQDSYFASAATARAVRLALLGDIAQAWLNHAADSSLLTIGQSTAQAARKSVDLTRARLQAGVAPRTDLRQAETVLATAESDIARQTTLIAQDANALTLLVGAPIDPALLPGSINEVGATIGDPPAGLSSEILLRRPDVVAAEYNLRGANAQIGAARAALFPKISLSALVGITAGAFSDLFTNAGTGLAQAAGSASYPIFRAGAGRANLDASKAQRDAALATYEKAIQTAFREVSDALARRGTIDAQLAADTRRTDASADTLRLSDARYRGGVDSFLQNLDAQRSLYTAQRNLVATKLAAAANRVTLYRTLGGDLLVAEGGSPTAP